MSYNRSVINCLSFLTLLYFFFGFFINENSAGAGGFDGDLSLIWKNLQLIKSGILQNLDSPLYNDSRPPLAYIIHAIFNPFTENLELFRFSVLAISLTVPALLYFSIKANYPNVEKNLILAFSLIITLILGTFPLLTILWKLYNISPTKIFKLTLKRSINNSPLN